MYCRRHEEHFDRHGSYHKGSYSAAQLLPHRRTAKTWLQAHRDDLEVRLAIQAVEGLYARAGAFIEAFRLRGLPPADRAKATWARLRESKVLPAVPLELWLTVELVSSADVQAERKVEFKHVQAGKLVHRLAGGSHRRWERSRPDGSTAVQEFHVYPQSRGKVLRHLGKEIEAAAHLVVVPCLADCAA